MQFIFTQEKKLKGKARILPINRKIQYLKMANSRYW